MTMSVLSSQNVLQYYSLQRIMSQCYFHESNATGSWLNKDFPRNVRNLFYFQSIKYNRIIQSPEVVFTVYVCIARISKGRARAGDELFPQKKPFTARQNSGAQSNGINQWIKYRIKVVKCKYYDTYSTVW